MGYSVWGSGVFGWNRDGAAVSALALIPPMRLGFDSPTRCHMWVEFVVGSRP